jgi:hypothetical protein
MGVCFSCRSDASALKASKNLEKMMNQSFVMESEKIKLLLLGAGESGKSTIFKQMRVLFGAPLTEDERNQITPVVYSNTISAMKALVQAVRNFGYEDKVRLIPFPHNVIYLVFMRSKLTTNCLCHAQR